ncbi:hypothetical protein [Jiella sp. M17.18]
MDTIDRIWEGMFGAAEGLGFIRLLTFIAGFIIVFGLIFALVD